MEDSFSVRVDRAFGSLELTSSSSSSPSSLPSLWRLTDEEIQRNEWIRDKLTPHDEDYPHPKNRKPYSSFLDSLLQNPKQAVADSSQPSTSYPDLEFDLQDLDDDEDEDDSEDENQQPPLSKPENEDWDIRSSMGMDCTLDNEEEEDGYDKVAVGREESTDRFYMRDVNDYEVEIDSNTELPTSFSDVIRDPRANHMAAKQRLKEDDESANKIPTKSQGEIVAMDESLGAKAIPNDFSRVPDYVRNPSKYTHYTFDSLDDVDEESNRKAYMELFNSLRRSQEDGVSMDPPKAIMFTPKKIPVKKSGKNEKKVFAVSIAADDELCGMEEEPEMAIERRGGRRYRRTGGANVAEELE